MASGYYNNPPTNLKKWDKPQRRMYKKFVRSMNKTQKPKKTRLSIPPVNQNPQPNNNQPTNTNTGVSNSALTNQASSQTNNKPPAVTPDMDAFSSYQPAPGVPDPRDDQYWRDTSRLYFDRSTQEQQLNVQDTYSRTAYEQALESRARQHPRDTLATNIGANRAGNLTSSVHQQDLGDLEQNYFTDNTDQERQYQQEQSSRNLMRSALQQGYTIDEAAQLAASVERQSQNELNQSIPPGVAQVNPTVGPPPAAQYPPWLVKMVKQQSSLKKKTEKLNNSRKKQENKRR